MTMTPARTAREQRDYEHERGWGAPDPRVGSVGVLIRLPDGEAHVTLPINVVRERGQMVRDVDPAAVRRAAETTLDEVIASVAGTLGLPRATRRRRWWQRAR